MSKSHGTSKSELSADLSWVYTLDSTMPTVPGDYNDSGTFSGASCVGLNCVAVGNYTSTVVANPTYPLIATSGNGGASWTYTLDSATTPAVPEDYYNSGSFNSASASILSSLLPNSLRFLK